MTDILNIASIITCFAGLYCLWLADRPATALILFLAALFMVAAA